MHAAALLDQVTREKISDSWDSQTEMEISRYGERCLGYQWLHSRQSEIHGNIHSNMVGASISLSSLGSLVSAVASGLSGREETFYIFICLALINASSAALIAFIKFLQPGERCEKHTHISHAFHKLATEINLELSFRREERSHSKDFLERMLSKYSDIIEDSLPVSGLVIKEFQNKMEKDGTQDIAYPEIANGYFTRFKKQLNSNVFV